MKIKTEVFPQYTMLIEEIESNGDHISLVNILELINGEYRANIRGYDTLIDQIHEIVFQRISIPYNLQYPTIRLLDVTEDNMLWELTDAR